MSDTERKYTAFISYRHIEPDMTVAKKLHTMLETYRIPGNIKKLTGIKKIGKIFRDKEELPLSRDLGSNIYGALDASDWLIVVASPDYLGSLWCMEELHHFIETGKKDKILVVLANGEPENAFPEELLYIEQGGRIVKVEPLAADARGGSTAEITKKLKTEKLRILAPILGVTFDELRRRDRERKLINILKIGAVALALTAAFAVYAVDQSRKIEAERRTSAENEVKLLTEKAIGLVQQNERKAARQYALDAYRVSQTIDGAYSDGALDALSAACYSGDFTRIRALDTNGLNIENVIFSPDDTLIAAIAEYDMIACFDAESGELKFAQPGPEGTWDMLSFSPDGKLLLAVNEASNRICVISSETGEVMADYREIDTNNAFFVLSAVFTDNTHIWITDWKCSTLIDLMKNETVNSCDFTKEYIYAPVVYSAEHDKAIIFTGDNTGKIEYFTPNGGKTEMIATGMGNIASASFTPDGTRLVLADYPGQLGLYDTDRRSFIWKVSAETPKASHASVTPDGKLILLVYSDHVDAYSAENGEKVYTAAGISYSSGGIGYTADGRYWFFDAFSGGLYRVADGKCYAKTERILAADHSGLVLIMNEGGVPGENNMVGCGSVSAVDEYGGELVDIPSWNPLKKDVMLYNSWNDTGTGTSFLLPQMYVSPDGRFAVSVNDGSYIKIWDIDRSDDVSYRCYQHTAGGNTLVRDVAFTADSRYMATAGYNGCSTVIDLMTGKIVRVLEPVRNEKPLGKVKFNADGSMVMLLDDIRSEAWIYSVADGTELYHLYAGGSAADFGFDKETGNGVIVNEDGTAQIARIFSDTDALLRYAAEMDDE